MNLSGDLEGVIDEENQGSSELSNEVAQIKSILKNKNSAQNTQQTKMTTVAFRAADQALPNTNQLQNFGNTNNLA